MDKKFFSLPALAAAAALAMWASSAQAAPLVCNGTVTTEGPTSYPGYNVGEVETGCQIGSGTSVLVNPTDSPVNYEFEWTGGSLTIEVETYSTSSVGSDDFVLWAVANDGSFSSGTPTNDVGFASIPPTVSQTEYYVIQDYDLPEGTYTLSAYCTGGMSGACADGADPGIIENFFVPEPTALTLMGTALVSFGWFRRKRSSAAVQAR